MAGSAGRTARRRRRRSRTTAAGSATPASAAATPSASGAPLGPDPRHVELRRWMRRRGFGRCSLQAAVWPDTGRGLMARRHFQPGDVIISVPERCLLTASTLLDTYLGRYLRECSGSVTALQALCVFLICERFFSQSKTCLPLARDGDPSLQQQQQPGQWGPYIAVLPASYSCPAYFSSEERSALPAPLRQEAEAQVAALLQDWRGTRPLVRLLQPLFPEPVSRVFCKDAFRWAWCSVNTRAVYLPAQPCPALAGGTGSLALAPVLDLLNHHPSAKEPDIWSGRSLVEAAHSHRDSLPSCAQDPPGLGCDRRPREHAGGDAGAGAEALLLHGAGTEDDHRQDVARLRGTIAASAPTPDSRAVHPGLCSQCDAASTANSTSDSNHRNNHRYNSNHRYNHRYNRNNRNNRNHRYNSTSNSNHRNNHNHRYISTSDSNHRYDSNHSYNINYRNNRNHRYNSTSNSNHRNNHNHRYNSTTYSNHRYNSNHSYNSSYRNNRNHRYNSNHKYNSTIYSNHRYIRNHGYNSNYSYNRKTNHIYNSKICNSTSCSKNRYISTSESNHRCSRTNDRSKRLTHVFRNSVHSLYSTFESFIK
ncbi:unnamed protein product [Lampetra fluviatilis]